MTLDLVFSKTRSDSKFEAYEAKVPSLGKYLSIFRYRGTGDDYINVVEIAGRRARPEEVADILAPPNRSRPFITSKEGCKVVETIAEAIDRSIGLEEEARRSVIASLHQLLPYQ